MLEDQDQLPYEQKVDFLSRPENYREPTAGVERVETHMSQVFLTDAYAYKLKKPVRYPFLDFSTVEARRRDCLEEVRLNRRLADDVYLGVVALRAQADRLTLDGDGLAVDWLVHMVRLPEDRMLDRLILDHRIKADEMRKVTEVLGNFYKHAIPEPFSANDYRQQFANDVRANAGELLNPEFELPSALVTEVCGKLLDFIFRLGVSLDRRALDGRIVEAHGDLRPEHVCVLPKPVIIDCLEFKREFRILDPADELAFLVMECQRLNGFDAWRLVFPTYSEITGDHPPTALIHFYMSYRAALRAKLAIWHLKDSYPDQHAKWQARAREYLGIARTHAEAF